MLDPITSAPVEAVVVLLNFGREAGIMDRQGRVVARWPVISEPMEIKKPKKGVKK